MLTELAIRLWRTTDPKCLRRFLWNFGAKGAWSVVRFHRRRRRGEVFPPFLFLSIINSCNLRCEGCWADVDRPRTLIETERLHRLIREARRAGNVFFGLMGGEPFLHPGLFEILERNPDCYFQIFTNGQLITPEKAERLRRLANATPLVSIEGDEAESDRRRGGRNVFSKSMRGLRRCIEAGLVVGVATSVCAGNIRTVCREAWLDRLIELGVHYVWYHGYRPAGPRPAPELALRPSQLLFMRRFIVEMRSRKPIIIVDPYYDHAGRSLCPMVTGVSHHINPSGGVEPCPVIQFAADWIDDPRGLRRLLVESRFLAAFREAAARTTRGCVLLERPELVAALAEEFGARDATLRGKAKAELARMTPRFSQWLPGREIPEKHWAYRWIKRLLFHDCGAYRGVAHEEEARALELARQLEKEPAAREAAPPARCGG